MKKILFIFCLFCLFSCSVEIKHNKEQPPIETIDSTCIQYDVRIGNRDVDIRVIPVTKDGETHDYVVGTAVLYKAGGISIDHWPGCKCFKK